MIEVIQGSGEMIPIEISLGGLGSRGEQGIQGLTGATGLKGDIGLQGIQGETGVAGSDYNYDSVIASLTDMSTQLSTFGAKGDGIADDTIAIETALNSGLQISAIAGKTYKITRTIMVTNSAFLKSSSDKPFYIKPTGVFQAFSFVSTLKTTTVLAQDVFMNKKQIVVQDAVILKGDLLNLKSSTLWYYDNRATTFKGETQLVGNANLTGITLDAVTWDTYKIASETVTIKVYTPITVVLDNFEIVYDTLSACIGLVLGNTAHSRLSRIKIKNAQVMGIGITNCYDTILSDIDIDHTNDAVTGFGIQDNGSTFTKVYNSKFTNGRAGIDFSGITPCRGGIAKDCICIGEDGVFGNYGFGTHGSAEHITFENNTVINNEIAFYSRGASINIRNNTMIGLISYGVAISYGTNVEVTNNIYRTGMVGKDVSGTPNALPMQMITFAQISTADFNGKFIFKDNKAEGLRKCFIQIGDMRAIQKLVCENNTVYLRNESSVSPVYFIFHGYTGTTISNSTILDNDITVVSGVYTKIESVVVIDYDTCYFDDIGFTNTVNLAVWGGTGTLANTIMYLKLTRLKDSTRLVGYIKFDVVTSTVAVRINNLPIHNANDESAWLYSGDLFRQGLLKHFKNSTLDRKKLYISYDPTSYGALFPVGTGYMIPINAMYYND